MTENIKLRKNISKSEVVCKHCGRYKEMDSDLLDGVQQMRDNIGKPITITSSYRCKNHPIEAKKKVPGEHAKGTAMDIKVVGMSPLELYNEAIKIPQFKNGGIGIYPGKNIIHVDTRGHMARWSVINGVQRPFLDGYKLLTKKKAGN